MTTEVATPYAADSSLPGKLRRRYARLTHRRPLTRSFEQPTVTFSFDDVPASALSGGEALKARGVRGTYYLCSGLFDREGHMGRFANAQEVASLIADGHEVGCHTVDHVDCHRTATPDLQRQSRDNVVALQAMGASARHFAFPYGEISPRTKQVLGPNYGSLRGVAAGLVNTGSDLNQLASVGFQGPDGEAFARHWIDRAIAERAWVILFTHDVRDQPSPWGCTPDAVARIADHALASGCRIATVSEVLD